MPYSHIFRAFPCCTLVGKGYSYSEANTVNKMHISNFKLSTPALMVDNLVENVHECPLNGVFKHTVGSVKSVCCID